MWMHVCPVIKKWYFKNCTSKNHKLKWSGGSLTYRCSLGRWEWSADAESESEWVPRSKPATLFCRRCGGPCFHFDRPVVDHSRPLAVGPPCVAVLWWRRDAVQSADGNWKLIRFFFLNCYFNCSSEYFFREVQLPVFGCSVCSGTGRSDTVWLSGWHNLLPREWWQGEDTWKIMWEGFF